MAEVELERRVGWRTATALVVGGTIGIGILVTTAGMARGLSSPALLFGVWGFMGAAAICGALCFGELAARYPEAGGSYVYLREAFGGGVAFLYGWKCLLVMDPGLTATLATALGAQAHVALPWMPAQVAAIAAVLVIAIANLAGVRLAVGAGNALAVAKAGFLIVLVVWGFLSGEGDASRFVPFVARGPDAPPLLSALAGALIMAFFAFGGWWETTKLAGEIRDPQRSLPLALALGVAIVTLLYVSVSAVFLYLVPLDAAVTNEAFAEQVGEVLLGAGGGRTFSGIVAMSLLGSLFAFMTVAPRVYYAMARDGVMPASVGRLHPRTGVPVRAVAIQAALAVLLICIGTFESIMAYFVFVTVVFLGLTVAGLFPVRRRGVSGSPYKTPFFPLPPALFLASIALVLALLAGSRPVEAGSGVAVVALGLPVYRLLLRRKNR